jgi:hypothetical protein
MKTKTVSPQQKAAATRLDKKKAEQQHLIIVQSENDALRKELSEMDKELELLKRPLPNAMAEFKPREITAQSLRKEKNQLEIDKAKVISEFDNLIKRKDAEISDFIKKAKSDIEILS